MKKTRFEELQNFAIIIIAALLSAFGLHIFVYSAEFAPSGVDGIATMLQKITKINAGIFSLVLNAPLIIWSYFSLSKKYALYTVVYTLISSAIIFILGETEFYQYTAENGMIISAVFSGVMLGVRTGLMFKVGASTGGVDIIASIVNKKKPHVNVERIVSILGYTIIAISFFVYKDFNCILLSIVQIFVLERAVSYVLKDNRSAIEFKIITKDADALKEDILFHLRHGASVIDCKGMYTGAENQMILSIVNRRQVGEFLKIVKKHPGTFVYYSNVSGVYGNFRWKENEEIK